LSFIDKIPEDKLRDFSVNQYEKNKALEKRCSELQSEKGKLERQLGIQEDGFIDTPSLSIIRFDKKGRPNCEKHGAMNCYDHEIYRCIMCGVAVQLEEVEIIVPIKQSLEQDIENPMIGMLPNLEEET